MLLTVLVGGCTVTTGVNVAYQPATAAPDLAQSQALPVKVYVTDRRLNRSVAQSVNTFGMVTANVETKNSVSSALENAFEEELHNRGFTEGEDGNVVSVTLRNFENQYTPGLLTSGAAARMDFGSHRQAG